jgi:hypothetical protein
VASCTQQDTRRKIKKAPESVNSPGRASTSHHSNINKAKANALSSCSSKLKRPNLSLSFIASPPFLSEGSRPQSGAPDSEALGAAGRFPVRPRVFYRNAPAGISH